MAAALKCEGTKSTGIKYINLYGREICASCGNCVFPKKDGTLKSHKAINYFAKHGYLPTEDPELNNSEDAFRNPDEDDEQAH